MGAPLGKHGYRLSLRVQGNLEGIRLFIEIIAQRAIRLGRNRLRNRLPRRDPPPIPPGPARAAPFGVVPGGLFRQTLPVEILERPSGHWGYKQGAFIADPTLPARTVTANAQQTGFATRNWACAACLRANVRRSSRFPASGYSLESASISIA